MNIFLKKKSFKLRQLQSSKRSATKLWQKIIIGIVMLFLLTGFLNIFQSPIRNSFYSISSPFSKAFRQAGSNMSVFFSSFFNASALQENDNLKKENQKLLSEVALLQDLARQNQLVQEALDNTKSDNFKMALVQIIGLDLSHDAIIINKGLDNGISENMPLISGQKVLYGRVFKVYKNFSHVMLISNKDSVLNVKIQSSDAVKIPVYGAVKGNSNTSVFLDLVNADSEMKEGDILITSALEGTFPKNLLVGKITSINKNDLKPFQSANIQPFFDIKNIDTLFVITDYMKK